MTQTELAALQKAIQDGFKAVNDRLDAIESDIKDGFADTHQGLHGIMYKLLTLSEVNEIRSKMKNPPDMKEMPYWMVR
jgi:hypothetical protein